MVKHKKNKIREPFGDRVFTVINGVFLAFCFLIVAYPLIFIVSASFSDSSAVIRGEVWLLPVGFDLKAYEAVFRSSKIMSGYMNSIIYTVLGTLVNLILTTLTAYPLSRSKLFGKKGITWYFLFTMFFSGGLMPLYITINDLGL